MTWLDKITVLDEYNDWHVHSAKCTFAVPALAVTREYFNFDKIIACTKENVFLRDLYKCQYCYDTFSTSELTWDHVLPRSHGGKTEWTNVVTACCNCNHQKGSNHQIVPVIKPVRPDYWQLAHHDHVINKREIKHDSWRDYIETKKRA